jgi:hypothetical protein
MNVLVSPSADIKSALSKVGVLAANAPVLLWGLNSLCDYFIPKLTKVL